MRPGTRGQSWKRFLPLFLVFTGLWGCAEVNVIPRDLTDRLDRKVTFEAIKAAPSTYKGHFVVLGGVVLAGKRLREETRLEVLQLPLDDSLRPDTNLMLSKGRFLAFQKEFLDPATLPPGTPVTVVGEMAGATTTFLDEMEYLYLTIEIRRLTVWPKRYTPYWFGPYPYFGAYWGSYWGPYLSPRGLPP